MPMFKPGDKPGYRTLCGLTHDPSGKQYNKDTSYKHELKCDECIKIQGGIKKTLDNLVDVNRFGHIIKVDQAVAKIRDQFGLSARRARLEVGRARSRRIERWGGV